MAIRLRTINGVRVALCAAESDAMPGDVYLDDGDHEALGAKFALDHEVMGFLRPGLHLVHDWRVEAMASQKVRDAQEEHARWEVSGRK